MVWGRGEGEGGKGGMEVGIPVLGDAQTAYKRNTSRLKVTLSDALLLSIHRDLLREILDTPL